jgi:hypothetical protein
MENERTTKVCSRCKEEKPLDNFGLRWGSSRDVRYPTAQCKSCRAVVRAEKGWNPSKEARDREKVRAREIRKRKRRDPAFVGKHILEDSRRYDRKKGFSNDLDLAFIEDQIKDGCSYCGDTEMRPSLDRIDNDRGHLKDNVVAACVRCNLVRGNMPHAAWLELCEGMRRARLKGLFGDWQGKFIRK